MTQFHKINNTVYKNQYHSFSILKYKNNIIYKNQ